MNTSKEEDQQAAGPANRRTRHVPISNRELIREVTDALDRLLKMFMLERYLYLTLTSVSFLAALFAAFQLLSSRAENNTALLTILGGSGLIATSSARISLFLNKAFSILENVFSRLR